MGKLEKSIKTAIADLELCRDIIQPHPPLNALSLQQPVGLLSEATARATLPFQYGGSASTWHFCAIIAMDAATGNRGTEGPEKTVIGSRNNNKTCKSHGR